MSPCLGSWALVTFELRMLGEPWVPAHGHLAQNRMPLSEGQEGVQSPGCPAVPGGHLVQGDSRVAPLPFSVAHSCQAPAIAAKAPSPGSAPPSTLSPCESPRGTPSPSLFLDSEPFMVEGTHVTPPPRPCLSAQEGRWLAPSFRPHCPGGLQVQGGPVQLGGRGACSLLLSKSGHPLKTLCHCPLSVFNCQKCHHVTEGFLEKNH